MNVVKHDHIRPFDIDGTLIVNRREDLPRVDIIDPLTNRTITMSVNKAMVRLLKEEHHRGNYILVWSRGGYEWARNVIQALDLVPYVHQVMTKPICYFDDKPVKKWMKDRVFIGPDEKYKE